MKKPKRNFRLFSRLRSQLLYHPKGRIIHYVLHQSILTLIILYIFIYIIIALGFTFLYMKTNKLWDNNKETFTSSFPDSIHFSFTTQATLGYGDLVPHGSARFLSALQAIIGIGINAFALGLIVIRMIRRNPNSLFADQISYNKDKHEFTFWFWNREADDFCDVISHVILKRKPTFTESPFLRIWNYPVKLSKSSPLYISSMTTVAVSTSAKGIDPICPPDPTIEPSAISVVSLRKDDELIIILSGISVDSGASVVVRKSYKVKDIKCGIFRYISSPEEIDTGKWYDSNRNYGNFNKIELTPFAQCKKCNALEKCPINIAHI